MASNPSNLSKGGFERSVYKLVLKDEGRPNRDGYLHPPARRLAALLKAALRNHGMRAVSVEVVDERKAKDE